MTLTGINYSRREGLPIILGSILAEDGFGWNNLFLMVSTWIYTALAQLMIVARISNFIRINSCEQREEIALSYREI